jgi:hypothetical protein
VTLTSTPLHAQRFTSPPETIADLLRRDHTWHLVRGDVLAMPPPGARPLTLPLDLTAPNATLARVDVEETAPYARPRLLTLERGRDFYFADGSAVPALVRLADDDSRLHPDVELHLGTPFVEHPLRARPALAAFVRLLSIGDPVYVLGRVMLEPHDPLAGFRDAPLVPCFGGDLGPLHLFDEPAFRQLAAWYALPWYRKLSLLVRNR